MIPAAFTPFLEQAPFCVRTRLALESLFQPQRLDALFRDTATRPYEKELLFSQVVELMLAVVLRVEGSVHAAYRKRAAQLPVSDQAIYDKLRCRERGVAAALVRDSASRVGPVSAALEARWPPWLPGYRVRVLDGDPLSASQRRLRPLRQTWAAALPGKVLAVSDQEADWVTDVFLTPDGHAQERALLGEVLPTVRGGDLGIADRNFCTVSFLYGIGAARAHFVIRQHGQLPGRLLGRRRPRGRTDTGQVYEQERELVQGDRPLRVRRGTLVVDQPTRDGDTEIHVLTNLPARAARAGQVMGLYRPRWTIEGRCYEVTQTLNCEPNTLGYPKAALFAFCLALVASNAVALLKGSLRAAHDPQAVAEMSSYPVMEEVRPTYVGMMVALPPTSWAVFATLGTEQLAQALREAARHVQPRRYRKARRGPKKPPPPKAKYKNGGHVSTHKLLESRRC